MKHYWILGLALGVSACSAQETPAPAAAPTTPAEPVFECFRLSYAWGFSLSGAFVDRQGTIWRYGSRDRAHLPTPAKEQGKEFFASADLQAKYAGATRVGNIDAKILAEKSAAITDAAEGTISSETGHAVDAGSSTCHAYVLQPSAARVRDVQLGTDGAISDTRLINSAPQAQELLAWLKSIGVAQ